MSELSGSKGRMTHVVPSAFVDDLDRAVDFYVNKLGFEVCFRSDEPDCEIAVLEQDDIVLHVCTCGCDDKRHLGNSYFQIRVDDPDALYEEYQAKGVPIHWELVRQSYGQTDFTIVDPDGNWITFAGPFDDED